MPEPARFAPGDRVRLITPHPLRGVEVVVRSVQPIPGMPDLLRVADPHRAGQWPVFADEAEALVAPVRAHPICVGGMAYLPPKGDG